MAVPAGAMSPGSMHASDSNLSLTTVQQAISPCVVSVMHSLCGLLPSIRRSAVHMLHVHCPGVLQVVTSLCACYYRWFIVDDVDMLEEDLQLLKSLFDAEGEGLSRQQIEELCAPLAGLLVVMQLDSGILMANYKQVPPPLLLQF